jgi:hypothetical protein
LHEAALLELVQQPDQPRPFDVFKVTTTIEAEKAFPAGKRRRVPARARLRSKSNRQIRQIRLHL